MKKVNFLKFAKTAAQIADAKKGQDVTLLNVVKQTPIADYFLIVTAESRPQINAIVDSIEKELKDAGASHPIHRDGQGSESWSVLDYGGLIVHVMSPEARNFYAIDRVWDSATKIAYAAKKPKKKTSGK